VKMLSSVIALSLTASVYAGDLANSLSAASESDFLAMSNVGWTKTAPAHYELETQAGERIAVGFGREAMVNDLTLLEELADVQLMRLAKAVESREKVRLRDSISQTHKAIASIQQGLEESAKAHTFGTGALQGYADSIALQADFFSDPGVANFGSTTIEAWGPESEFGSSRTSVGTVTLTAIADEFVNTTSALMVPSYGGQYLSVSANTDPRTSRGTCKLQARASVIPSCSTAGYRSVSWTSDRKAVYARSLPNPVYADRKPRSRLPTD
jgi:hypothetical protein